MTRRKAFTLVELLVVIGIIALLIAILMPALSRARKQALQASCGSNERQVTYGALAYANDWKEQLPTRLGLAFGSVSESWPWLSGRGQLNYLGFAQRLPIIGWDTVTVWDWGTYTIGWTTSPCGWLGGWAFTMRDYLKNDFDIYVCPDGFYTRADLLTKYRGRPHISGGPCGTEGCGPIHTPWFDNSWSDWWDAYGLQSARAGYLWLPHRVPSNTAYACGQGWCASVTSTDQPGDIAKTASDKPDLLVMCDLNLFSTRDYGGCGRSDSNGWATCGVIANHNASSYKQLPVTAFSQCMPVVFPPNIGRQENPIEMPLGMNKSRIDARVTWQPWQDWNYYRHTYIGNPWHSF